MASKNFTPSSTEEEKCQTACENMKANVVVIQPLFRLLPLPVPGRYLCVCVCCVVCVCVCVCVCVRARARVYVCEVPRRPKNRFESK